MIILSLFIIGLFIGSFLNVLIDRFPHNQSIIFPPSHCEHCKHRLFLLDLIPLLSFVFLHGKCRYCKKPIAWWYPVIEITTALLFVTVFLVIQQRSLQLGVFNVEYIGELLFYLFAISSLIVVFFSDLKYGIIPFAVVIPASLVTFIYHVLYTQYLMPNVLLTALGAALFFLAIYLLSKGRGIGFGDVVLSFYLGLLLGFPYIIPALYIAFLTGALVSLILIITGRKKLKGSTIAFGPFLVIGTLLMLFGEEFIMNHILWYFLHGI